MRSVHLVNISQKKCVFSWRLKILRLGAGSRRLLRFGWPIADIVHFTNPFTYLLTYLLSRYCVVDMNSAGKHLPPVYLAKAQFSVGHRISSRGVEFPLFPCFCGIIRNLISERWLIRDLLEVVHIFHPRQLPVLSKQCATSEWQIYLDLATEKSNLMTSHLLACSGGQATKTGQRWWKLISPCQ